MNTTGSHLTGIGAAATQEQHDRFGQYRHWCRALRENTISEVNVAVGDSRWQVSMAPPAIDGANTALGSIALTALTSGQENVAVGRRALEFLTSGNNNIAVGWRSGDGLTTGSGNTFIGNQAGVSYTSESNSIV